MNHVCVCILLFVEMIYQPTYPSEQCSLALVSGVGCKNISLTMRISLMLFCVYVCELYKIDVWIHYDIWLAYFPEALQHQENGRLAKCQFISPIAILLVSAALSYRKFSLVISLGHFPSTFVFDRYMKNDCVHIEHIIPAIQKRS